MARGLPGRGKSRTMPAPKMDASDELSGLFARCSWMILAPQIRGGPAINPLLRKSNPVTGLPLPCGVVVACF